MKHRERDRELANTIANMRDCGLHIAAKTVCFPEVRVKSKTSEHIVIFGNKNSRSLKHETGVWSTDLGFSPHFWNNETEVCGKFRNPRANRPFRGKKPQVEALPLSRTVARFLFSRIPPNFAPLAVV